ncbi:AzlC family ABC transporter permease [Siccirubricoccus sp. KC 17139]|uniref:AzlC family ABC transporter permease n=1 Tax=Siccirubricoccus soli TaxID=2899147 RepID=A0ABT1DDB7_9PROT|nr:AzlC family ABC transporter permease [Siccirubricoccus soli]MCO6419930.1 AzlC family ABC transporter permease [Siccirubricoccus soli]MCP2686065.1 AzlC family ABC transporter permease [Siccirubricoccus soli]
MQVSASFRAGAALAFGAPALAMGVTFLAFGAAVAAGGLGLGWALGASLLVYGMAGQVVLLGGAAGPVLPAVLGATAANARFLPMAVAIGPLLGPPRVRRWLALPFIAITPWAAAMRVLPALPAEVRLGWFLGFALVSWVVAGLATCLGFWAAPLLGPATLAALVFANPLYFALLMADDLGRPGPRRAVLAGVAAAPLALLLPPAWGILAAGLLGGTAAFLLGRHERG